MVTFLQEYHSAQADGRTQQWLRDYGKAKAALTAASDAERARPFDAPAVATPPNGYPMQGMAASSIESPEGLVAMQELLRSMGLGGLGVLRWNDSAWSITRWDSATGQSMCWSNGKQTWEPGSKDKGDFDVMAHASETQILNETGTPGLVASMQAQRQSRLSVSVAND